MLNVLIIESKRSLRRGKRRASTATWLILLALLSMGVAADGSNRGTLTGTVVDSETHAPLAQVRVKVTSPTLRGGRVVMTNSLGVYRMETLPPGVYTMACEKDAYASLEQRGVNVVQTWSLAGLPIGGTLPSCNHFGIPSTSRWTGAAIIAQSSRTKSCTVTRPRASPGPMPSSLAG